MRVKIWSFTYGLPWSFAPKVCLLLVFLVVLGCGGGGGGTPVQNNDPPVGTQPPPPEPALPVVGPSVTGPLSGLQISNLALLGKVWGFLKYHHPSITGGQFDWDRELIFLMSSVLDAGDATASHDAVLGWLQDNLGEPAACNDCATEPADYYFLADVAWINDESLLGAPLSAYLQRVYQNRPTSLSQFYVSLGAGAQNAVFDNEDSYAEMSLPDGGFRLLGLFRLWNMVQYFFPYRDIIGEPWDNVLFESIAEYYDAVTRDDYARALVGTFRRINDTHANLWGGLGPVLPPQGDCRLPVGIRFIEDSAAVTAYLHDDLGPASGLEIGDVLLSIDGRSIASLIDEWSPFYPASNEPTRLRDIARFMTRGACAPVSLEVQRDATLLDLIVDRIPSDQVNVSILWTHDLPGPTFQSLAPDIGYLKLSSVIQADSAQYIADAAGTDGLIIDIRNFPNEFVVFSLGQHLVSDSSPFATFTKPDLRNPGAFVWVTVIQTLQQQQPFYGGKVAILIDETTQSQAEYTTMAFRTAPDSIVIGSTTAGADGNVSSIPLPGDMRGAISGLGVFYPDRSPTQRIGIIPDMVVEPTIVGIREGRDELLDYAIAWIRGVAPAAKVSN